jgi:hypothetical protein
MKKILLAASLLITVALFAQKIDGLIKFDKTEYSFGKIPKDKPVTVVFNFTNPATGPLIIEDATAECGCTKPEFTKTPIMGGKKGKVTVTYDAKTIGSFTKHVTVKLVNVTDTKVLTISGEVLK